MNIEKTPHQILVEHFMRLAKQDVPESPQMPPKEVRYLRAVLIYEEALETIASLGFMPDNQGGVDKNEVFTPILKDIIDGCLDLRVVSTGTLSACGIKDNRPQFLVDDNNLQKISGGTLRADGKLIKPPGHVPPDLDGEIARQIQLYKTSP